MILRDVLQTMRPTQWTKNAVVLAAFVFALGDPSQNVDLVSGGLRVAAATLAFCLVSSGIYAFNDIFDVESDRRHPRKRHRPLAAGRMSVTATFRLGLWLLFGGALLAWLLSRHFALAIGGYIGLQAAYTLKLKHVALLDVMLIAAGFVLRAIAGATVLNLTISPWLLLCTFLLALFLALCKRRHEKLATSDTSHDSRPSLEEYDSRLLDQLISIVAASTIVSYAMYTLSEQTIVKFGTAKLGFTIPFVVFGVFRYLDLAYRHEQGERPEKILLTDPPILINLVLYGATVMAILLLPR